jgi:hypothetical protein
MIIEYVDDRLAWENRPPATTSLGGWRAVLKSFAKGMPDGAALRAALEKVELRDELAALAAIHQQKCKEILRQNLQNKQHSSE